MNTTTLLRSLKGAPISVLMALLFHPAQSLGVAHLSRLTGYSDKPVAQALRLLADLQLAQNHNRYRGWVATTHVRQLILGETENLRLAPSSSSSIGQRPFPPEPDPTTTTTQPRETENLRLPSAWAHIAQTLVHRCTTPTHRATAAATAAMHRHDDPDHTLWQLLRWLSYCRSDDGAGINNPGAFIATRIEQDIPCPDWHRPTMGTDLHREISRLEYKLWPEQ